MSLKLKKLLVGASIVLAVVALVTGVRVSRVIPKTVPLEPAKTKGPLSGSVFIIEFSDFQCSYCAEMRETLDKLLAAYPNDLRVVFKNFPLEDMHATARLAAESAECAAEQGRFWGFHDLLFLNQSDWAIPQPGTATPPESMQKYATALGLNLSEFNSCLESGRPRDAVQRNIEEAHGFLVGSTPTLIFNGQRVVASHDLDFLKGMVKDELHRQGKL